MRLRDFFERRKPEKPASIHPAFQIIDKVDEGRYWRWNFTDFSQYLKSRGLPSSYRQIDLIKVAFAFDDPRQLENRMLDLVDEIGEISKEINKMSAYGTKKPEFRGR